MAFDPNSMPKDLRPLNLARTMPEETRIAPVTTLGRNVEGFYGNPPREAISPASAIPVYYSVTSPDAGFVGSGCSNAVPGVAGWSPRMPTSVAASGSNSTTGCPHNPNLGTRAGSSASDHTSDEGGGGSVSGKKVKLLCSFGGKILARPSDGKLRYVGGQTRIISVRRDVSFNELVQKMIDVCGQNVIIKYQLPDEDLDALVSVSCSEDLQNMMDEHEKLVARSSDGLAKLRVFLFSPSEFDPSGMVQFGELQDSGQKYFEAVNEIIDGVGSIAKKESIASAPSTQNSDMSRTEVFDSSVHGQGDVTGLMYTGISPKANSATSLEPASRLVCVDSSTAYAEASSQEPTPRSVCADPTSTMYAGASNAPLGIPVVMSAPPQTLYSQPEHELERSMPVTVQKQQTGVELQQPGVNFRLPAPYLQAYVDAHQETLNRADYGNSQMGFPTHLLGTVGHVFTHSQFHENAAGVSSHQFVPSVHMIMTPASNAFVKPNMVLPFVQPQHIQLERHPNEGTFGARAVQLPADQSYNACQAQVPHAVVGGGYGWNQVPQKEHVVLSEGWIPHQQDQGESPAGTVPDLNTVYHSLQLEDKMGFIPMNRAVVTGALGEGTVEQQGVGAQPKILSHMINETGKPQSEAAGASQNVTRQLENDGTILQKVDNPDHPKVSYPLGLVGLTDGMHPPYGIIMGTLPQPCPENAVQQLPVPPQHQVQMETLVNKSVHSDIHPGGGVHFQMPDHQVNKSPKDYSTKVLGVAPIEDPVESCDLLKQIDRRMENLQICPSEVLVNNKQSKSPNAYPRKEDIEARPLQNAEREPYPEHTFSKPRGMLDTNHIKQNEVLPSTNEVPYLHNIQSVESSEVTQPPHMGSPISYQQSNLGINYLAPDEGLWGKLAFPGVNSALSTERNSAEGRWRDNLSQFQPKVLPGDVDAVTSYGNTPSSLSPFNRVGDVQETPCSVSSSQDTWNLQPDTHLPPPKPNKIAVRKGGFGMRDPSGENHLENSGELPMSSSAELTSGVQLEDGVYQPMCNMNTDFGSEHTSTTQGSAEQIIKQELQAVTEGVSTSVLQPSMPINPDITMHERSEILSEANQDGRVQNTDVELHEDNLEDIKAKLPEKTNLGFPVSDGIGRLQIINNGDLEELQELGSGTFGTVYHGMWRGTDVAIKRINDRCFAGKPSERDRMRYDFWNEAINLADLHHPNVVAFYGVVLDAPGGSVATVTEYMVNGSLRNALEKNGRNLDKRKRLLIAMDVAFGMEYLHGKNIVHFDLKSDNLLVTLRDPQRPICKVGDLGLSKVKCHTLISGGVRGTLPWMAPELLNGSSSLVSEKVDVFSFGIVLWELLTGEEPYADLHYGAIIGGIVSNTLRPPVPESCDPEWRSLMERCWSREPSERPSFTEIANQLRAMAAKIPPKAHAQQQAPSTHPQVKS